MAIRVELDQLLNLALGTPELGAVNFNILHGVLREILNHLGIEKKGKEIGEDGDFRAAFALLKNKQDCSQETSIDGLISSKTFGEVGATEKIPLSVATFSSPFCGSLESKVANIEKKLEILDDLPSNGEILQRSKQKKDSKTPVADMWQFININRRLGATETAIEKLTSLLDTVMREVGDVKEAAEEIKALKSKMSELEKLNASLSERITALESVDSSQDKKKLEDLLKELQNLKKQVDDLPTKDDLNNLDIYVKWPQLEEALNARRSRAPSAKSRASTPQTRTPTPPPLPPARTSSPTHPSPEALEALRQIGELMDKHEMLVEGINTLEGLMPKKANIEDLEDLRKRPDVPDDILEQLKLLKDGLDAINEWKEEDGGALNALRSLFTELQGEQEKLSNTTKELIEEHNRKQKHIDALYAYADKLQEVKADKEQVAMEMDVKADKRALDNLVSRSKFDQSIGGLDQSLQELLQRLERQESELKDGLDRLAVDIEQKLDRLELNPLKEYFEKKIKHLKCRHVDLPVNDDPAAGIRKTMLRFHCISCDRPVDMIPGNPNPALPQTPGLPPSRSGRPYTTYELDQIRQVHRGGYTYEQEVATTAARACGGSHTVTFPHRRTARFNQYYYYREDDTPVPLPPRDETDLIGQDGHIYKGRFDAGFDRMPDLPPNPRSPRAMSAQRATSPTPPRNGSPTNRRPRSAAVPSSTRNQEEEMEPAGVVVQ